MGAILFCSLNIMGGRASEHCLIKSIRPSSLQPPDLKQLKILFTSKNTHHHKAINTLSECSKSLGLRLSCPDLKSVAGFKLLAWCLVKWTCWTAMGNDLSWSSQANYTEHKMVIWNELHLLKETNDINSHNNIFLPASWPKEHYCFITWLACAIWFGFKKFKGGEEKVHTKACCLGEQISWIRTFCHSRLASQNKTLKRERVIW